MNLTELFDTFSRRTPKPAARGRALTKEFRHRVLMLCRDEFVEQLAGPSFAPRVPRFWLDVHKRLQFLLGRLQLSIDGQPQSALADVLVFLDACVDAHFLDFIELIFKVEQYHATFEAEAQLIESINMFFRLDDLPYALTPFARETRDEEYHGRPSRVTYTVATPRVIRRDDDVTHQETIVPVLTLLSQPSFGSANAEFLDALSDYRKGDYPDCLTKCASAFESVLKIICVRNRWPVGENDTVSALLRTVIEKSGLDPFFEQPLIVVGTLRNKLSPAHGAGTTVRHVPEHKAKFAINATAAGILLVVEHCR